MKFDNTKIKISAACTVVFLYALLSVSQAMDIEDKYDYLDFLEESLGFLDRVNQRWCVNDERGPAICPIVFAAFKKTQNEFDAIASGKHGWRSLELEKYHTKSESAALALYERYYYDDEVTAGKVHRYLSKIEDEHKQIVLTAIAQVTQWHYENTEEYEDKLHLLKYEVDNPVEKTQEAELPKEWNDRLDSADSVVDHIIEGAREALAACERGDFMLPGVCEMAQFNLEEAENMKDVLRMVRP